MNEVTNRPGEVNVSFFFGIAATDKELNSRDLNVFPIELLPFHTPLMDAKNVSNKTKAIEGSNVVTDTVTTKNYIEAEYLDLFTNRVHPPDVRKGEQVLLFRFTNSEKYWWMSQGRDDHLRRTERYRIAISDDTRFQKELNDENTYFLELDTLHGKSVTISTSRSDGEKHRYKFKIDANESSIYMCDDDDNEIRINTEDHHVYMRNNDGCMVELDKRNVTISAIDDIILKAGRQIARDTPVETQTNTTNTGTSSTKARAVGIQCTDSFVTNAPSIGLNGQVSIGNTLSVAGVIRCAGITTGGGGGFSGGNGITLRKKGDEFLTYPAPSKPGKTLSGTGGSGLPSTVSMFSSEDVAFKAVRGGDDDKRKRFEGPTDLIPVGSGVFKEAEGDDKLRVGPSLVKVNKFFTKEEQTKEAARLCMEYRKQWREHINYTGKLINPGKDDEDMTCHFMDNDCAYKGTCKFADTCDQYMDQGTAKDEEDTRNFYGSQPDVDIAEGEGSGSNDPIKITGSVTSRHAAAWEQVCPSLKFLALDIRRIHYILSLGVGGIPIDMKTWPEPYSEAVEFLSSFAYLKDVKGD